jgi:hypothetical protein
MVKLAYFGGYSNREIAREVGLTEGAVQRRLRRALAAISDHVQHGRALGRRAMYGFLLWSAGRWAGDAIHSAAQGAAVATAAAIIITHPAPLTVLERSDVPARPQAPAATPVVPPVPSPTAPITVRGATTQQLPSVQVPPVTLPVAVPTPSLPPLPTPLPKLP